MNNFIVIVLDGVGIGELPDASLYNDEGSNTLANIAKVVDGLNLPKLEKFGLGNIIPLQGINQIEKPIASYGKMSEASKGKDSTTGHWEIGGLKVTNDFPYYPQGFPDDVINKFLYLTGLKGILGNKAASGTEIIEELGAEHIKTGFPIIYTSADSVFQIAAHEEIIPLEKLYEICEIARNKVLIGKHSVARIIARPFTTIDGIFTRTTNRKDFSLAPPEPTILDYLFELNINTVAIGKINDLFNYKGIREKVKTKSNIEGIIQTINAIKSKKDAFIFTNLVDFDVYFGHRNDPVGFHNALIEFDSHLPEIIGAMDETDKLVLTADHGNDPTTPSTDHSREFVPLLYYSKNKIGKDLGIRETFSDVAQTICEYFKVSNSLKGKSFLNA